MKYLPYILILLLLVGIIYQYKNPKLVETIKYKDSIKVEVKYRYKSDTIYLKDTIHKTDTIIKFVVDSIGRDSNIYHYKDSNIDIDLQANRLDWLKYDIHISDTVYQYREKIINVYDKKKRDRGFYYGIGGGFGYGLIHSKFDIFVGGTVGYKF